MTIGIVVMISVVDAQRETLLDPRGNNVWSGYVVQSANSEAVTWSLAKELYGPSGPYFIIPMGLLVGMVPTAIQWLISKVCWSCSLLGIKVKYAYYSAGLILDLSGLTALCYLSSTWYVRQMSTLGKITR